MGVSSWLRRQFNNGTITTGQLATPITNNALSFSLGAGQGSTFPDGSVGSFIVTLSQGASNEERVLCASRSGDTFTVAPQGRGYNGYAPVAHGATELVLHTMDQQDLDEANQVAVATLGQIAAGGDLLVGSGPHALAKLARGATNSFLQAGAATLSWVGFPAGVTSSSAPGDTASDGVSTLPPKADHRHARETIAQLSAGLAPTLLGLPMGLVGATAPTRYVGGTAAGAPSSGAFLAGDYVVSADGNVYVCSVAGSPGTWGPLKGYPLALAGATASTRYVGGTVAGPPSSGTFLAGDYVVSQDGHVYVCTVAGTPGTWGTGLPVGIPSGKAWSTSTADGTAAGGNVAVLRASGMLKGGMTFVTTAGNTGLKVPVAGTYAVSGQFKCSPPGSGTQSLEVGIGLNGTGPPLLRGNTLYFPPLNNGSSVVSGLVTCAANDVINLYYNCSIAGMPLVIDAPAGQDNYLTAALFST